MLRGIAEACVTLGEMPATLRFAVTQAVAAPPEVVWNVLGDFGTEHRWTRTLAHCQRDTEAVAVGTARTCTLRKPVMGRTQVREVLNEYEDGRALGYDLDGSAGPFRTASSRWSIAPGPDGSTSLTVEGRFTPRWFAWLVWPMAKIAIKRLARAGIRELEAFVAPPR
jgi:hypothetical protein